MSHRRSYLLLTGGRVISALGSNISGIAFPLLILALTHSPALAGLGAGLAVFPTVLLNLLAGAIVDRWEPRRLIVLCDAVRAVGLASIGLAWWSGHLSLLQIYAVMIVGGAMLVFYNTAVLAAIPRIVPEHELASASAQFEGSFYAVGLIGPALGGILYGIAQALPFLADAFSYLLSILSALVMRIPRRAATTPRRSLHAETRAGLAWFWRQPLIRSVSLIEGGEVILLSTTSLLVIVLARDQHASPVGTGLALSLGAIGGILGAAMANRLQQRLTFAQIMIGVQWARVVLYPLYAIAPDPIVLGLITAGLYALNPIRNAALFRYAVPLIPAGLLGRVMALWDLFPSTMALLGAPLVGFTLQWLGATETVGWLTALALALALLMMANPHVRTGPIGCVESSAAP